MTLADFQRRLQAPFPQTALGWSVLNLNEDQTQAQLVPHPASDALHDRLDAVCPEGWSFTLEIVTSPVPLARGRLTLFGVTRDALGSGDQPKVATDEAFRLCTERFGIGRYLHDLPPIWVLWDAQAGCWTEEPQLPDWARPEHERTAGAVHILTALDELQSRLPESLDQQRVVYGHLKAALEAARKQRGAA